MESVTTAIIAASGFNTRRLPVAAAVPKELLPIGNRPAVDYLIDDLVKAGITTIYLAINPFHRSLYEQYFNGNAALDAYLERVGKTAESDQLAKLRQRASFRYIDDDHATGYGSASPLFVARSVIESVPSFVYASSDDFTLRSDGGSDMADLIAEYQKQHAAAAMLGIEIEQERLSQFGVLDFVNQDGALHLRGFIEKPSDPAQVPHPYLANISKYIFSSKTMLPYLDKLERNPVRNEFEVTDICIALAKDEMVAVRQAEGSYYDVGTLKNWLIANEKLGANS